MNINYQAIIANLFDFVIEKNMYVQLENSELKMQIISNCLKIKIFLYLQFANIFICVCIYIFKGNLNNEQERLIFSIKLKF